MSSHRARIARRVGATVGLVGALVTVAVVLASPQVASRSASRSATKNARAAPLDLAALYRPGELLVAYDPGVDAGARGRIRSAHDVSRKRELNVRATAELVRLPAGEPVLDAARRMRAAPGVTYAEPNYLAVDQAIPNDPRFGASWAHRNIGGATGYVLDADIDTPQAWDLGTGSSSVRIGIADSGLADAHEDIVANLFTNTADLPGGGDQDGNGYVDDTHGWDFVDDDSNPADTDGHGTLMAGVAAAAGDNGIGVTGVNWRASIVPLRRSDAATVAEAFTYAAALHIPVVNASFALGASTAVANAVTNATSTVFVASAGNDGNSNEARSVYPCTIPSANVICVAANDADDTLASFSAFGTTSVDLAAPGGSAIVSAEPTWEVEGYSENFDSGLGGWTHGAISGTDRWGLHTGAGNGGTAALSDSPGTTYAANSQTWARSPTFSLVGKDGCLLRHVWKGALSSANLNVDFSTDGTTWKTPGYAYGLPADFETQDWPTYGIDGSATARMRFRLWTGASVADGATIDDARVLCLGATQTHYLTFTGGTSSAAAFVTGAIGLLLSREPTLSTAQIRSRLLSSVDQRPGYTGLVASNGRLNVARLIGAPIRPDNAVAPSTSGTFRRGETVHCATGTWAEEPTSFAYQWTRDGQPITGATGSDHVLGLDDGLAPVACRVTATNGDGSTSAVSTAKRVASAPLNTTPPSISGSAVPGSVLTCQPGTWRYGPVTSHYTWYLDGKLTATGATISVLTSDRGHQLHCVEVATTSDGSASASSAPVLVPAATPTPTPAPTPTSTSTSTPLPVVKVSLAPGSRLVAAMRGGLRVRCSASVVGRCVAKVTVTAREARRVHLPTGGRKTVTLGSAGATLRTPFVARTFTVKVTARYARILRKATRVRLTLATLVRDDRGRVGKASPTVTLRR